MNYDILWLFKKLRDDLLAKCHTFEDGDEKRRRQQISFINVPINLPTPLSHPLIQFIKPRDITKTKWKWVKLLVDTKTTQDLAFHTGYIDIYLHSLQKFYLLHTQIALYTYFILKLNSKLHNKIKYIWAQSKHAPEDSQCYYW